MVPALLGRNSATEAGKFTRQILPLNAARPGAQLGMEIHSITGRGKMGKGPKISVSQDGERG